MWQLSLSPRWMAAVLILASHYAVATEPREAEPDVAELLMGTDPAELTAWGLRYAHGEGVRKDIASAIKLYCKAARGEHAAAQYQLGIIYLHGRGAPRDDSQAAAWLGMAADEDQDATRLLRFVAVDRDAAEPKCLLPDGSEYLGPVKSVPDPDRGLILSWVKRLAPEYGLEPSLVAAVIRTESNFNPRARSAKNAYGLMQLMPATATRFGVHDIRDPVENLKGGLAYLRWLLDHFDGDLDLALAGYNAGENAVQQYRGIPPYQETRHYVNLVKRRLAMYL